MNLVTMNVLAAAGPTYSMGDVNYDGKVDDTDRGIVEGKVATNATRPVDNTRRPDLRRPTGKC